MTQIKIDNTEKYSDSTGDYLVCRGKVIFVKSDLPECGYTIGLIRCIKNYNKSNNDNKDEGVIGDVRMSVAKFINTEYWEYIKPIVFTDTNDNKIGDKAYSILYKTIVDIKNEEDVRYSKLCKKIIVMPEHFSPKHIQDIMDGKLKDGDEVFVECRDNTFTEFYNNNEDWTHYIKNNKHVNIFPINKEETWEDIEQEYIKEHPAFSAPYPKFDDWLKDNYNAPTRKKS